MNNNNSLVSLNTAVSLTTILGKIVTAYASAVNELSSMNGDIMRKTRNRLYLGSRIGAKVDGVHDAMTFDQMVRRSIMCNGLSCPVQQDLAGNHIYCFKLSHQYAGKGKATYVRIGDLVDKGPLYQNDLGVGTDYHRETDRELSRFQAPTVRSIASDIVTVILSQDDSTFIEWFCGEPQKIYTKENIGELITVDGRLIVDNLWVELGVDFTARSRETRRRAQLDRMSQNDRRHYKHQRAPINPVASALDYAQTSTEYAQDQYDHKAAEEAIAAADIAPVIVPPVS